MSACQGPEPADYQTLLFDVPEEGIGRLTLNRPEKCNAINRQMIEEFHDICEGLRHCDEIRVLILAGAGTGFCAGADMGDAVSGRNDPGLFTDAAMFLTQIQKRFAAMVLELHRLAQPVICLVQGPAAGGGFSLALASDLVYASPRARFMPAFINIGLSGGEMGSSYFLPRLVGMVRAAEILMTGRDVAAEEAEQLGLVCRVVAEDALMETAFSTARTLLAKSRMGLRLTKEALRQNLSAPGLSAAVELENRNQSICAAAPEFRRAVESFAIDNLEAS